MKLETALPVAQSIAKLLAPHCERIHIAGSVRRQKLYVKDIEIVCEPEQHKDLFGEPTGTYIDEFALTLLTASGLKPIKGNAKNGKYCQLLIRDHDINLDLFMPSPHDYYRQLAIRIGPAEYSRMVIAKGWNKLGWVGTPDGLRLRKECENISIGGGKYKWKVVSKKPTLPPVWDSEQHFFYWLGVPYLEPENRN